MKSEVTKGKCSLCNKEDEGILITDEINGWLFVKIFICEGCISKFFRQFRKNV